MDTGRGQSNRRRSLGKACSLLNQPTLSPALHKDCTGLLHNKLISRGSGTAPKRLPLKPSLAPLLENLPGRQSCKKGLAMQPPQLKSTQKRHEYRRFQAGDFSVGSCDYLSLQPTQGYSVKSGGEPISKSRSPLLAGHVQMRRMSCHSGNSHSGKRHSNLKRVQANKSLRTLSNLGGASERTSPAIPGRDCWTEESNTTDLLPRIEIRDKLRSDKPSSETTSRRNGQGRVVKPWYPRLTCQITDQNIAQPSMYEQLWLDHQEIALKQLLNRVFDVSAPKTDNVQGFCELRKNMFELYQKCDILCIYSRVRASLSFGALRPTRDPPGGVMNLDWDLALRQRFVNFWLKTYDFPSVEAAAETIIGRRLQVDRDCSAGPNAQRPQVASFKHRRRALVALLEGYLLRNEDEPEIDRNDLSPARWQRTILRSLMLIYLLDEARCTGVITRDLFLQKSKITSSVEALERFENQFVKLPGLERYLKQLNFVLRHRQRPSFDYHTSNMALDFRDGIRLTYLAKLTREQRSTESNETVLADEGINHPRDATITTPSERCRDPTSSCSSRTQKLVNVHAALLTLRCQLNGFWTFANPQRMAENIVNGHREQTVELMLAITQHSELLARICDIKELGQETRRILSKRRRLVTRCPTKQIPKDTMCNLDRSDLIVSTSHPTNLAPYLIDALKVWSSAIAQKAKCNVENFTTSFADGRVFNAIIDEYQPFCLQTDSVNRQFADAPLNQKLLEAGCDSSFGEHSTSASMNVLTRRSDDFRGQQPRQVL